VIGTKGGLGVDLEGGHQMVLPVDTTGITEGDRVEVGIRPEDVALGTSGLDVSIRVLERLGGATITYGTIGSAETRFCASLAGNAPVEQGKNMTLMIAPESCHVFNENGDVLSRLGVPVPAK
jgi:multiple sugar transport system ATP-binding protein